MTHDATRFVYLPDPHGQFIDWRAAECAFAFLRAHKPNLVIVGGDTVDFYALSRFDKHPGRALEMPKDVASAVKFMRLVRHHAKNAAIEVMCGNHERRLQKWLWGPGAAMLKMPNVSVPKWLELGEIGASWHESGRLRVGEICFKHGVVVRKGAGNSARVEMEREGMSTCSGHVHRVGEVTKTTGRGEMKGVEAGCLCKLTPEYGDGEVQDWAHGLAYGAFVGRRRFSLQTANIVNGKTVYGDRVIAAQ